MARHEGGIGVDLNVQEPRLDRAWRALCRVGRVLCRVGPLDGEGHECTPCAVAAVPSGMCSDSTGRAPTRHGLQVRPCLVSVTPHS